MPDGEEAKRGMNMTKIIETPCGRIKGCDCQWPGVTAFKGIRYGAAGSWEYPEPVIRWEGVYDATQGSGLPVLFYIHGGGFTGGCGHEKHFDGSYIAKAEMSSGYGVNKMFGSANLPDWRPTTDGQDKVLCLGEKETHMGKPSALKMYFTMLTKKSVGE